MAHSLILSFVAAALLLPVLSASPSFAQNLLPNDTFDDDLSGWSNTAGKTWSPMDADGDPLSGSLQISISEIASDAISVCMQASGGQQYDYGVDVLLDLGPNAEGRAGMVIRYMSDSQCMNELSNFPGNVFSTFAPDWTPRISTLTVPEGAEALLVELRATKTGGSPGHTVTANLDNALLRPITDASPGCADPAPPFELITTADALYILRVSVGSEECTCVCDVNGSGDTTTSDALETLRMAVGLPATLGCLCS